MIGNYDDIINLPHWGPRWGRQRMSLDARAAQFAPFAALTGHDAAISETARLTDSRIDVNEGDVSDLNLKMALLLEHIGQQPMVEITWFRPDARKDGGAYVTHRGAVKRYDEYDHQLLFTDGTAIPITAILDLDGELFIEIG